jgi:mercuric ion transport protein
LTGGDAVLATKDMREKLLSVTALFGSAGTLLCCALPAALAALAGGAAIGAYVSAFPFVVPLSRHQEWIFLIAGGLVVVNGILTLRPRGRLACAITGGKGCELAGAFTTASFWIAAGTYAVGAFMAYGIVPLLELLEG